MTLALTQVKNIVLLNGDLVNSLIPDLNYESAIDSGEAVISVAGLVTDIAVPINRIDVVQILFLWVDKADINKLTLKLNAHTTTESLNPLVVYSGTYSNLTVSNSSTSPVNLYWRAIYV
jgi:hypothetical protein